MPAEGTGAGGVRLGVSGHRAHDSDPAAVRAAVRGVLDSLDARGGGVVVTSLAEGADRVVAEVALERSGWSVAVVLPLDAADYETDFADDASRAAFRRLLAAADPVEQVPPAPTREGAYLAAGLAVLDRSEALLVLWDGAPARGTGGTAEVVDEARRRGLPLAWIAVARSAGGGATAAEGPPTPPPAAGATTGPTLTLERWPWTP